MQTTAVAKTLSTRGETLFNYIIPAVAWWDTAQL